MARGGEFWATGSPADDDRAGAWQRMLSATPLPWSVAVPDAPDEPAFEAWVRRWWIDDLALVDCECSPCSGARRRRQVGETDGEFVGVLMPRDGGESVSQGDAEAELRPGDALIWDSEKPARFSVWEPLSKRSLLIPRAALEEVNGRAWTPAGVTLNGEAQATRLLVSSLDALSATLPALGSSAVS